MNRTYRSIWNDTTGTFVAAPELTAHRGKGGSSRACSLGRVAHFTLTPLALSLLLCTGAHALPVGGAVVAGAATVQSTAGQTTIAQTSANVAINWQSFNIAAGQRVQFLQPSSSSVALNRVLGMEPSSILGQLSANGRVFLVNPNGILFGRSAQVSVGGLVASTLGISDSQFMAGRYQFSGDSQAAVLNQGAITTGESGGHVALLGARVGNDGTIAATLGSVALAAGRDITLDLAGDGLLNVRVHRGAVDALVHNGGLIQADGGQVLLTAQAAGQLLQTVVNNTGVIQARSLVQRNGTITLLGDMDSGTVNQRGTLDVSGLQAGQTGGEVAMTAHHVGLFDASVVNASGDAGGGSVRVGGGFQGKDPGLASAAAVFMGKDAVVRADAVTQGQGGTVVLWSDGATQAFGAVSARGGAFGGDGGMIETSGHTLVVDGLAVDAGAPRGTAGTWLLDPFNVTINLASANGGFTSAAGTDTWTPAAIGSTILNTDINARLNAGTNVSIQTNGSGGGDAGTITVAAPISRTVPGALTTLTLTPNPGAGGTLTVGASITGAAGAPLAVRLAGQDTVAVSAPITTFGGDFFSSGSTFTNAGGAIDTSGGRVDILHATTVAVGAPISTSGGAFRSTGSTFTNAGGTINTSSSLVSGGALSIEQTATVSLASALTTHGGAVLVRVGSTLADTTTIQAGTGVVTIQPDADATTIGIGTNTSTLIVTNTEIGNITAGRLIIGRTTGSAAINIGTNEAVNFGSKDVTIQQTSGGITAQTNSITGSGSMLFMAGTGTFTNAVAVNTTGAITITADNVATSANVGSSTAGAVTVQPSTLSQPVNIASIAGGLNLTAVEVGFLRGSGANTGSLTLGSPAGTGVMTVGTAGTPTVIAGSGRMLFTNGAPMTFNGAVSAAAQLSAQTTAGNLTVNDNLSTTDASALAIVLNAGSGTAVGTTTGGDIIINGATLTTAAGGRVTLMTGGIAGSTGVAALVGAGSGRFRYNSDETNTNFTAPLGAGAYAIYRERPTLTVTASSPAAMVYGTATPVLTSAVTGLQNGDTSAQALSTAATVTVGGPLSASGNFNVGAHAVTAATAVDQLGYALSYVDGALVVNPAALTVTASAVSKVYGQTPVLSGFTTAGLVAGETVGSVTETSGGQVATAAVAGSPYAIVPSAATGGNFTPGNYTIAYVNAGLTVTPAPMTVTAGSATKTYGQTPALVAFTTAGLVNGETVGSATLTSAGTAATAGVAGSPYAIVPSAATGGSFTPGNYTIGYVNGALSVSPAAMTVTAGNASKTYGDAPVLTAFTTAGLVNGETVGSATLTSAGTPATAAVAGSPYAIVPSGAAGGSFTPGNYTIGYVNGVLTVVAAPLTVTAGDASKTFGQTPVLTAFTTAGLVNGETVGGATLVSAGTPAGATAAGSPYAIVPSAATGGSFVPGNYTIAYVNGALTVVAAVPPVVPPVVIPPVVVGPVTPPLEVPPLVVPPVVTPPVVTPPVVTPPVVAPPVDVPPEAIFPGALPPVATLPGGETPGGTFPGGFTPVDLPPGVGPTPVVIPTPLPPVVWIPQPVPPQLVSLLPPPAVTPPGATTAVVPPVVQPPVAPPPAVVAVVPPAAPVIEPVVPAPRAPQPSGLAVTESQKPRSAAVMVVPDRPPRQDRN